MRLRDMALVDRRWLRRHAGGSAPARCQRAGQHLRAALTYRTGAVRRLRHPDRQRHGRLPARCSTSATAASAASSSSIEECETGYDTKKGVECYESVKAKNPVVVNPYSTGITLQLIPKAAVDKIPILSMAYGLSASADGNIFPWIFNPPATYWDGAVGDHQATSASKEGGLDKLKGKTIGYIYLDARLRQRADPAARAARQGVRLHRSSSIRSPAPRCRTSRSQWLNVRRDRPTGSSCGAGAR